MTTLTEFLLARIAEDEAVAQAAVGVAAFQKQTGHWRAETVTHDGCASRIVFALAARGGKTQAADLTAAWEGEQRAEHIARHDPARVLAECEAKRRIVEETERWTHYVCDDSFYTCEAATVDDWGDERTPTGSCSCGRDRKVLTVLRLLALPYSGHPEYRQEWAP